MSHYIRILNTLKLNINSLILTPSQAACRSRIEDRLSYPGAVNLYGLHGVGKTVLGWAMAANEHIEYVVHPLRLRDSLLANATIVFIDNVEADRSTFRRLMGTLEAIKVERTIVVTHVPIDDYVFRVELELTEEDILIVRKNFQRLGYSIDESGWNNLWQGLLEASRD